MKISRLYLISNVRSWCLYNRIAKQKDPIWHKYIIAFLL